MENMKLLVNIKVNDYKKAKSLRDALHNELHSNPQKYGKSIANLVKTFKNISIIQYDPLSLINYVNLSKNAMDVVSEQALMGESKIIIVPAYVDIDKLMQDLDTLPLRPKTLSALFGRNNKDKVEVIIDKSCMLDEMER